MRASGPALICGLLLVGSCGEREPAHPPDGASPEPALRAETEPRGAGAEPEAEAADGEVRLPRPVEGALAPIELRDRAVTDDRGLWNRSFLGHVHAHEIHVADAVALTLGSLPRDRWEFAVVRTLDASPRRRAGERLTGFVPGAAAIETGDRWVLLGNRHKGGFHVIAAWEHTDAVVSGLEHLRATLDALRDGARARDRRQWQRSFARDLRTSGVWLCRTVGPDATAPARGPDRWLFEVGEVLHGDGRPGPSSCRVAPSAATALEADAPVILVVAGHPPTRDVQGWWPRTPEVLSAIRLLVAIADR